MGSYGFNSFEIIFLFYCNGYQLLFKSQLLKVNIGICGNSPAVNGNVSKQSNLMMFICAFKYHLTMLTSKTVIGFN